MTGSDHDALQAAERVGVYGLGREGRAIVDYLRRVAPGADVEVLLDDAPDEPTRRTTDEGGPPARIRSSPGCPRARSTWWCARRVSHCVVPG